MGKKQTDQHTCDILAYDHSNWATTIIVQGVSPSIISCARVSYFKGVLILHSGGEAVGGGRGHWGQRLLYSSMAKREECRPMKAGFKCNQLQND